MPTFTQGRPGRPEQAQLVTRNDYEPMTINQVESEASLAHRRHAPDVLAVAEGDQHQLVDVQQLQLLGGRQRQVLGGLVLRQVCRAQHCIPSLVGTPMVGAKVAVIAPGYYCKNRSSSNRRKSRSAAHRRSPRARVGSIFLNFEGSGRCTHRLSMSRGYSSWLLPWYCCDQLDATAASGGAKAIALLVRVLRCCADESKALAALSFCAS